MNTEMNTLLDAIKADYVFAFSNTDVDKRMTKEFNEGLSYKVGKKYIKVINGDVGGNCRSVWGFVVNVDDDTRFKKGDILKAAGWAAPARNQARGNIIDGGYTVQWTGPNYLK
jgi:hypothetical protein